MPTILIEATTDAETSQEFRCTPGNLPRGVAANNLVGAETVVISRDAGDGVFVDLTDVSATLTADEPTTSILAGGIYKVTKSATASACAVSID